MNLSGMDFRVVIFMGMLNWALKGLLGFRPVECPGYSFKGLGNGVKERHIEKYACRARKWKSQHIWTPGHSGLDYEGH